ncbi:MAG: 4Fe-4S dicluster domain-containing protein [Candidatus Bathyarchaeia archaeon]
MPQKSEPNKPTSLDIFQMLTETKEKEKKRRRTELLAPLGIKEFFTEGSITINKRTCHGLECKLCIKACPTNALFWKAGEVGISEELCIYCGACVLSCIVDDCIRITRKRETGEVEKFSKPREFVILQKNINTRKLVKSIKDLFTEATKQDESIKKS